ncbi:uncharacterized protein LOC100899996 isoform X2 [Galendromus occidentalis]|uniref:Uncharacterized protein LOC100899996 isoform X2 n=1 Tax=Galendromus occidentalis TaxID=34638 RepID=A0AAJ7L7D4_9ACAR|nr:uncharacterized protein LOC100899996 isoform X2 [Galendromus occidentalis]
MVIMDQDSPSTVPHSARDLWPKITQAVMSDGDKDHAVEFCNLIDQTLEELTRIHEMVERKTKEESLNGEHPDMKNGVKKKARMKFTPKRPQDAPRQ